MPDRKDIRLHELEATARRIGNGIGDAIERKHGKGQVGFCLMMFTFGEGGWSTYLSNAEPESMIEAIRELADSREQQLRETGK